jgi:shikimate dehydrogenase
MLVAQARRSAEQFARTVIPDSRVYEIADILERQTRNVVLIGMPGCGKTTVGQALAGRMGRPFIDADALIAERAGMSIPAIFAAEGEAGFRTRETAVLKEIGQGSGAVIATGGGCVTRAENYPLLHQNGVIVWIRRSLDSLPIDGRPLSQANPLETLYAQRKDRYAAFADIVVDNDDTPENTVQTIWEEIR